VSIFIEQVRGGADRAAMLEVWAEVFGRELGITPAPAWADGSDSHLLARLGPGGEPVGTLSVVDTSDDRRLQESCRLGFGEGARCARFMHLAVTRPFRGRNVPLLMALEAHRLFVAPRGYDYTWLLFDAERARASFLSRWLGFEPRADVFASEYGRRCPLVRDERAEESAAALRRAARFLEQSGALYAQAPAGGARHALGV